MHRRADMDRTDRFYALHQILKQAHHPVSSQRLQEELECSPATLRRTVQQMRDHLGAPIESSRANGGGYWYAADKRDRFDLPGLWFSPGELYALVASLELLRQQQPGLLAQRLEPLRGRIEQLLSNATPGASPGLQRIRVLSPAVRHPDTHTFRSVATAVLN